MTNRELDALLRRIGGGDKSALAALYEGFRMPVYYYALRLTGNPQKAEDVMQETYLAAAKRLEYFAQNEDVPIYFKLRTILLQTLADIERKNLQAAGRDAYREAEVGDDTTSERAPGALNWGQFAADVTSPLSRVDRNERHALLRAAVASLPENDRAIIVLRHFDGMGNSECAAALGIESKAASIRYVRALERLREKLMELSCFKKNP